MVSTADFRFQALSLVSDLTFFENPSREDFEHIQIDPLATTIIPIFKSWKTKDFAFGRLFTQLANFVWVWIKLEELRCMCALRIHFLKRLDGVVVHRRGDDKSKHGINHRPKRSQSCKVWDSWMHSQKMSGFWALLAAPPFKWGVGFSRYKHDTHTHTSRTFVAFGKSSHDQRTAGAYQVARKKLVKRWHCLEYSHSPVGGSRFFKNPISTTSKSVWWNFKTGTNSDFRIRQVYTGLNRLRKQEKNYISAENCPKPG
jgi:hypothetical protein